MKSQVISCAVFALALLVCQAAAQHAPTLLRPLQINDAGGAEPKLGGERARDELDPLCQTRAQAARLSEETHALGQRQKAAAR